MCRFYYVFTHLCVKTYVHFDDFILNEYRIPRTLLGLLVGCSLAISGAIIQGVVRNPLASPDVIGISKGASLAAVILIMVFHQHPCFYYQWVHLSVRYVLV